MRIIRFKDPNAAAVAASHVFSAVLREKPDAALGLATGSTPLPLYGELSRLCAEGLIEFKRARTFNLDEYVGLAPDHPASYRRFMDENLFDKLDIPKASTRVPSGVAPDLAAEAAAYDAAIREAGGIDLQLLGIGANGHIGFNEPAETFPYATHVVSLTPSTIEANKRFFASESEVPRRAITLGIGAIMEAKRVLLIATGSGKAEAIRAMAKGDVDPRLPASILRCHRNAYVFVDEAAAAFL